jgi:hypothetical protein
MALVICERVEPGLRDSERSVLVRDVEGPRSELRVEKDFLWEQNGRFYLPVGVVQVTRDGQYVLIEMPQAVDAGTQRLWVRMSDLLEPVKLA